MEKVEDAVGMKGFCDRVFNHTLAGAEQFGSVTIASNRSPWPEVSQYSSQQIEAINGSILWAHVGLFWGNEDKGICHHYNPQSN